VKMKKARFWELHWPLIGLILLIAGLGVYNLHSSAAAKAPTLYLTQLSWLSVGLVLVLVTMALDYRIWENLAYLVYGVICLLLLAVLVLGAKAGGAQRWLVLGSFRFQPSELAKIGTILCLARYFGSRVKGDGYSLRELFRPLNLSRPASVAGLLALGWSKPWMVDPGGEFTRFVYRELNGEFLVVGDLLWFRSSLLLGAFIIGGLLSWFVIRYAQVQALLNPWPPGRKRHLIIASWVLSTVALGAVGWFWGSPWMRDPLAMSINYWVHVGGPGGIHETVVEVWWFKGVLLGLGGAYFAASVVSHRRWTGPSLDLWVAPMDLLALPALLILVEPDLGTAGIVVLIGMTMVFVVGIKPRSIGVLGIMGAVVAVVGWFGILKDYQKRRILTFLDPENDIRGAGWNAIQSLIAVGSGRWFGKGHKEGTQTQLSFLPEQHTDFAFSVWAEEQGFVGCAILLALYLVMLLMAFGIAAEARETYGALLAVGVTALLLWQSLINVGMVIGVAPVVGMTLPLFSYGGSSIVTTMLGLGLLLNVHWRRRNIG